MKNISDSKTILTRKNANNQVKWILSLAGGYFHLMFAIKDNTSNLWTQTESVTSPTVKILRMEAPLFTFYRGEGRVCGIQTRPDFTAGGLKLLYWTLLSSLYYPVQIASQIFLWRIHRNSKGKVSPSVLVDGCSEIFDVQQRGTGWWWILLHYSRYYNILQQGQDITPSPTFAWLKIEMVEQETAIGQYRSQMPLCTDTSLAGAKLLLCNCGEGAGTGTNIPVIT